MSKFQRFVSTGLALALAFVLSTGLALAAQPVPAGKLNLNSATAAQLVGLPGIGEKLAARILEYRQKAGSFKSAQELMNVKGIGEKTFQKLQGFLSVSEASVRSGESR